MLDINEMILAFAKLADLEYSEACEWSSLLISSEQKIFSMLREKVSIEENEDRLTLACAAYAYCVYCSIKGMNTAKSIKTGDFSVTNSNCSANAEKVKMENLRMISDIIKTSQTAFEGVEVNI